MNEVLEYSNISEGSFHYAYAYAYCTSNGALGSVTGRTVCPPDPINSERGEGGFVVLERYQRDLWETYRKIKSSIQLWSWTHGNSWSAGCRGCSVTSRAYHLLDTYGCTHLYVLGLILKAKETSQLLSTSFGPHSFCQHHLACWHYNTAMCR